MSDIRDRIIIADLRKRIASLEAALAEKERELTDMREAIRNADLYGSEFCPWCREEMRWINFGGKQHKPDCIYARLKVGEATSEEK